MPLLIRKNHPVQVSIDNINKFIAATTKYHHELIRAIEYKRGQDAQLNLEFMAVQQQLEVLTVIKKHIDTMRSNIFLPLDVLQDILLPESNDSRIDLNAENAEAYFDLVCRKIADSKFSNSQFRSKLTILLSFCLIVGVVLGCVTLIVGISGGLTPFVIGALSGLLCTAAVPLLCTLDETPLLIKNEAYLDAVSRNNEPDLFSKKHYFSFDPMFRLKGYYEPLAIHIDITDEVERNCWQTNVYCHTSSEEKCNPGFFRYATVKLSDGLANRIIAARKLNLADKSNAWYQPFEDEMKQEIQSRPFTAVVNTFGIGKGKEQYRDNQRYYLEGNREALKTMFFAQKPTKISGYQRATDQTDQTISSHILQMARGL